MRGVFTSNDWRGYRVSECPLKTMAGWRFDPVQTVRGQARTIFDGVWFPGDMLMRKRCGPQGATLPWLEDFPTAKASSCWEIERCFCSGTTPCRVTTGALGGRRRSNGWKVWCEFGGFGDRAVYPDVVGRAGLSQPAAHWMQNIMLRRRAGTDAPYLHPRQHRDAPVIGSARQPDSTSAGLCLRVEASCSLPIQL